MSFDAPQLYHAYGRVTDFRNYQGNPMPKYGDLPDKIKEAWEAVVKEAIDPWPQSNNLNYGQVLHALQLGYKVARAHWTGYWVMANGRFTWDLEHRDTMKHCSWDTPIAINAEGNMIGFAMPYWSDQLATDWRIIE